MSISDRDEEPQTELPLVDAYGIRRIGAEVMASCAAIARHHGWSKSATALDESFGPEGRPVSQYALRNAMHTHERNHARLEWIGYFGLVSDEPLQVLASAAGYTLTRSGKLTPEQELELYRERLPREFGMQGAKIVASISGGGRRR